MTGGYNDTQVTYVSPPSARDVRTQRIVRAADDYLCANPARPVYTEDLCTALGTSATRLHQAFDATFGISPHRYLKLRRMSMVRAALLSGCGPWRSVKAAALSHGFWHLGQFAQDYRALYGEAPSNTLAHAPGGAVGALRDQGCPPSTCSSPARIRAPARSNPPAPPRGGA
jgi:AraC-like DNA-binding protein